VADRIIKLDYGQVEYDKQWPKWSKLDSSYRKLLTD
jgi:hypothetical protein